MENSIYENENIERKCLKNIWKNQFLKVKNNVLELEKDFIELKDRELKEGEAKIEKEIEEPFFKPIILSLDDMDKFEKKRNKENKAN